MADLPLWGIDWSDPPLPRDLLNELTDWQETFDQHYDPFSGWASEGVRDKWAAEGARLEKELRRVLGPAAALEVDLWPLRADGDGWRTTGK